MDKYLSWLIFDVLIALIILYIGLRLKKYDPLTKPKGIVLWMVGSFEELDDLFSKRISKKASEILSPLLILVIIYFGIALLIHACVNWLQFMHYVGIVLCLIIVMIASSIKARKERGQ